ncbi:unnamed protein product [Ectocarpus sp. 12 AP-2014]
MQVESAEIILPHIKTFEERGDTSVGWRAYRNHANESHHGCLQMHGRVWRWQPGVFEQCP